MTTPTPDDPTPKKKRPFHRKRRIRKPRTTPVGEHVSVLPEETLAALALAPGQIVIDATLGFGGHTRRIAERLGPTGQILACDLDRVQLPKTAARLSDLVTPIQFFAVNFAGLRGLVPSLGLEAVDAILADLGVSSMQLDDRDRGFSFLRDGPLDMRMDPTRGRTAADLLESLSETELTEAFTALGDEPQASRIAAAIVAHRAVTPLRRTRELITLIESAAPVEVILGPGRPSARKQRLAPLTRVFQALRMLVNREPANLQSLLKAIPALLKPGGRAVFISFHSGEDRLVKAAFREGKQAGLYRAISDEPVRPSAEERLANPRSRSAKLRWAVRA